MVVFINTSLLPKRFAASRISIPAILKEVPVFQCENCSEYLLDDSVMKRVEDILEGVDSSAELEVIKFAA